ncbi:hypothetical protein QA639_40375 [Bradyrhizobium pachyrhizi]|uniref:hypothetical protein n=1 Tax=Bradyrhizobium pachyrhizi TaxID=280333 RepID=UPI0024B1E542|nr:hypothetical protein [Bradyrhizobium pachyrhizi]WFU55727.1 hypothetical protein QA639_40375 [Bradyrhizobium pachyrhizi]
MTSISKIESRRFPIDTTGFRIPCRKFAFALNVSRDRRFPVVDEFVLRVLRLLGEVPVRRLRSYFGFSSRELEIVLSDLVARGHVVLSGENVSLHAAAEELFSSAEDELPRIVSIEPWNETVSFDMVASNLLSAESPYATRHFVEVKASTSASQTPIRYAEEAFSRSFRDYVRNLKGIKDADGIHLYSISHVEPKGYGWSSYKTTDYLTLSSDLRIETDFGIQPDKFAALRPLIEGISAAKNSLRISQRDRNVAGFVDRLFGNTRFSQRLDNGPFFQLRQWLDAETPTEGMEGRTRPVLGSLYLPDNVTAFLALAEIGRLVERGPDGSQRLIWGRPGGTAWGATPDLSASVARFKDAVRSAGQSASAVMCDLQETPLDVLRKFRNVFDEAYAISARGVPGSLEFLRVGNVLGFSVRVAVAAGSVPVGYITTDPRVVERFDQATSLVDRLNKASPLWTRTPRSQDPPNSESP